MTIRPALVATLSLACTVRIGAAAPMPGPADTPLGHATMRCEKHAELLSCYDALHLEPNEPGLLVAEADTLVQLERPGEAIGVYRNALTVGADRRSLNAKIASAGSQRRALLHACLSQSGAAAEHACESAWLPGAPDEVSVFTRRGLLLETAGDPGAALDAYMAAARLAPKDRAVSRSIVALSASTGRRDAPTATAAAAARDRLRVPDHPVVKQPAIPVPRTAAAETYSNEAEVTRSN